jgi:hypothetical protein
MNNDGTLKSHLEWSKFNLYIYIQSYTYIDVWLTSKFQFIFVSEIVLKELKKSAIFCLVGKIIPMQRLLYN